MVFIIYGLKFNCPLMVIPKYFPPCFICRNGNILIYCHYSHNNLIGEYFYNELACYKVLKTLHKCRNLTSSAEADFHPNGSRACAASLSKAGSSCGRSYTLSCVIVKFLEKCGDIKSVF